MYAIRSYYVSQQFFFGISYGLGGFVGALGSGMLYQNLPSYLFLGGSAAALAASLAFYRYGLKEPRLLEQH